MLLIPELVSHRDNGAILVTTKRHAIASQRDLAILHTSIAKRYELPRNLPRVTSIIRYASGVEIIVAVD